MGEELAIDMPDVLTEVSEAFAAYERALNGNDVERLNLLFWDDERTLRYGVAENLYGYQAIAEFRRRRSAPGPRRIGKTVITTFGVDCASASAEFSFPGDDRLGRQTQTWIRTRGGWRIAAAHVSFISTKGPVKREP
jgi:hypothetical protein